MMSKWLIIVLFLAAMFFDGIIFPGFFGFREGFLTVIFLVVVVLYYKVNFQGLILGIMFSVSAEFFWGLKFGILTLPLLASAGAFFLLTRFFSIRSWILMTVFGLIIFVIFWETSILINKLI